MSKACWVMADLVRERGAVGVVRVGAPLRRRARAGMAESRSLRRPLWRRLAVRADPYCSRDAKPRGGANCWRSFDRVRRPRARDFGEQESGGRGERTIGPQFSSETKTEITDPLSDKG